MINTNLTTKWMLLLSFSLILSTCSESTSSDSSDLDNWIIPRNQVVDGGPGKDGIPSIDDPKFDPAKESNYPDDRRIIGVRVGDQVKAYPHMIMDWHEIVNDKIGDKHVAVTFCPLTGTAIGWNRTVNGEVTEFGVSGLLFRNNQIPYDRNSDSRWSQMQLRGVAGSKVRTNIQTVDVVETTWATWKEIYPDSEVLTTDTGFSRNYDGFAYGPDYTTNNSSILFPIENPDDRLQRKERVHGVITEKPADQETEGRVYRIGQFGDGVSIIKDQLMQKEFVVVGSTEHDFAASFKTVLDDGTRLELEPVEGDLPVVMTDQEGNRWDLFGYAVEGPRKGERLSPTLSYTGYWFAWADFFPGIDIHKSN